MKLLHIIADELMDGAYAIANSRIGDLIELVIDRLMEQLPVQSRGCEHCIAKRRYIISAKRHHWLNSRSDCCNQLAAEDAKEKMRANRAFYKNLICSCGLSHTVTWETATNNPSLKALYHGIQ